MRKKSILQIRFIRQIFVILFLFGAYSCNENNDAEEPVVENDLYNFEKAFSNSLSYESENSVRLIGFKTMAIDAEELDDFSAFYTENKSTLSNYYLDKANASVRIYFPVESALVKHGNQLTEATQLGELNLNPDEAKGKDLYVIGRRQTDQITGVDGNIIKDGIIYLAQENKVDHRMDNLYIFDFGEKMLMDHSHDSQAGRVAAKASCMNNHGGPNCSDAFGIHKGRCTFNSKVCMDYNGWFTNCVNGSVLNFPGSDCDYALGAGHCWNEVM